jgi:transposase
MAYQQITNLLAIVNFHVTRMKLRSSEVHLWLERDEELYRCANCGQTVFISFESWEVTITDLPVWGRRTILHFTKHRIRCTCNQKLHVERLPWLFVGSRVTMRLAYEVHESCRYATILDVAQCYGLDWHTVKEIDRFFLVLKIAQVDRTGLRKLSIDEIAYLRRHKYLTIVTDLETHRVVWVGKDRRHATPNQFAREIGSEVCRQIKVVAIDMWRPYRNAIQCRFPNAQLVYDKFHVIKHLNEAVDQVRRSEASRLERDGRKLLKNQRWLLLKGQEKLTPCQQKDLKVLFEQNVNLAGAYILKEELREIYRRRKERGQRRQEFVTDMERWIEGWLKRAIESGLAPLKRFARMIQRWYRGVIAYFEMG